MPLDSIHIILHRPKGSLNIGYTARAMANTGFRHLRLSAPRCRIDSAAYRTAAAAEPHRILNSSSTFDSLDEALGDMGFVVGTTARPRHTVRSCNIKNATHAILERARSGSVALVFGPEEHGLTNTDLQRCDTLVTIPATEEFYSYNLSHAVLLVCHTLMTAAGSGIAKGESREHPAPHSQVQALMADIRTTLMDIGFLNPQNPDNIMLELRHLTGKAAPTERELTILRGICRKIRTGSGL